MHDIDASPLLVVGMEGVWGLLLCSLISMPIAQFLPGQEGIGLREDTLDSFVMLSQNGMLLGFAAAYMASILLFNIFGMFITETTDAMTRNILEPIRTLLVWVLMVFVCYVLSHQKMGERVNLWSLLELAGFGVLCFGVLIYNGVLRFPCLTYEPKQQPAPVETEPLLVTNKHVQEEKPGA
jgi:hypothetical protein